MILGNIADLALYDALNLCEFTLASGSLTAVGPTKVGILYLHGGALSFAEIQGRPNHGLDQVGIDHNVWEETRSEQGGGLVASALIDKGVAPADVRRFVLDRVEQVVAEMAMVEGAQLEVTADAGWFGHEITFPINSVIDAARVINFGGELIGDTTTGALVAMCPTEAANVTLGMDHWNVVAELIGALDLATLRKRVGHKRATEFVRFLQSRSLATAVLANPSWVEIPG